LIFMSEFLRDSMKPGAAGLTRVGNPWAATGKPGCFLSPGVMGGMPWIWFYYTMN
jgi:hypothetical protein